MKKFFEQVKKFSFLSLPLCFFSLVFLDFSLRLFYGFLGDTALLSWKPVAFTLGWSLLLTGLAALLPRLGRRILMGVYALLFGLLGLTHGVMYNIFGHFFTFSDMNFAGDGAKFFSWSYFRLRKAFVLCLVLFLLMMAAAILLARKPEPGARRWKVRIAALCAAVVGVIAVFFTHTKLMPAGDNMWWGNAYNPYSEAEVYREFTDANRCLDLTGLYQYTFRDFTVSFGIGGDHRDAEKLDAAFESREVSGENEMTGALKGKNLIMVMMESVDTWLVTPDYMPNLYALQQAGVNFENFYTPLYLTAGTFNTEIISQTGMIPAVSGMPSAAYSTNSFPLSLANLFRQEGYTANSFHSAYPSIYSRGSVHTNLGFEAYHCFEQMGMDDYQLDSQMIRAYDQIAPKDGSFFTYIITYSGHGPYNEEMQNIAAPHYQAAQAAVERSGVTGSKENMEEYTRAVAHAMETDQFVGELADKLKEEGRLEDTALLFYADHYGKYITDKEFLHQIKGIPSGDQTELYHTPCFLYGGGLKARTVDKYASSPDLVPTLVNLFSLPADARYYAGDDIFGDKGGVVMFPNYAWYDGETYYSADSQGEGNQKAAEISAQVKERMTVSMNALKCDYFKYWE